MASLAESMALPAAAGGLAVLFSHPLELTKVRLQLDNELAAKGTPRQYTGFVDCVLQNFRGWRARAAARPLAGRDARGLLQRRPDRAV